MKNVFSTKLYLQGLRKVRNAGIAMAIIVIVLNALVPVFALIEEQSLWPGTLRVVSPISISLFAPFGVTMILFAPLLVYSMFSYLNERKSSDFYHSIPQKRICVYLSFIASIMTWIVSVLLASVVVNSILWSLTKYYSVSAEAIWLSFAAFFIIAVMMAGFMTLAMMITGTTISNCLVFLLLLLFVRAIGLFFITCLEDLAPMFVLDTSWLHIFDLEFFMPLQILLGIFDGDESVFHAAGMYVYWLVVGILLFALAGFFYCRRRSENATKSAPNRIMQHIYRIAVTFPFVLLGVTFIIYENELDAYHLIFFVVALLVYVIYELITTKKIKSVLRSLPLFAIPALLCFVFLGSVYGTRAALYLAVPEEDEIESVALDGDYYSSAYEYRVATDIYVHDANVIKDVAQALEDSKTWGGYKSGASLEKVDGYTEEVYTEGETRYYSSTISVKLRSGKIKEYNLYSPINVRTRILNADECRAAYLTLPSRESIGDIYVSFGGYSTSHNGDDAYALWSCFTQEYASLSEDVKFAVKAYSQDKADDEDMRAYGTIEVSGRWNDDYYFSNYRIYEKYMPKTAALFREICNKNNDPKAHLSRFLTELSKVQDTHSCSFELEAMTGDTQFYFHQSKAVYEFLSELAIDDSLTDFDSEKMIYRCSIDYFFVEGDSSDVLQWKSYDSAEFFIALSEEDVSRLVMIQKKIY